MIDKRTAIKSILADLKKGISRVDIMHKISQNCTKDASTLRRWFTEAEKKYKEFLEIAEPVIRAKEIEAMAEVAASGILSKIERQKILTQIALGEIPLTKYVVADGVIHDMPVVPSWNDRKAAIAELNKMDGAYISNIDTEEEITEITIKRINGA